MSSDKSDDGCMKKKIYKNIYNSIIIFISSYIVFKFQNFSQYRWILHILHMPKGLEPAFISLLIVIVSELIKGLIDYLFSLIKIEIKVEFTQDGAAITKLSINFPAEELTSDVVGFEANCSVKGSRLSKQFYEKMGVQLRLQCNPNLGQCMIDTNCFEGDAHIDFLSFYAEYCNGNKIAIPLLFRSNSPGSDITFYLTLDIKSDKKRIPISILKWLIQYEEEELIFKCQ